MEEATDENILTTVARALSHKHLRGPMTSSKRMKDSKGQNMSTRDLEDTYYKDGKVMDQFGRTYNGNVLIGHKFLPEWYDTRKHILKGYRFNYTYWDCIKSCFTWHNETVIQSHHTFLFIKNMQQKKKIKKQKMKF